MLVAKGRSTPRIREELGLTAGTVNAHLSHLYRKLDVHDRQELIDLVAGPATGAPWRPSLKYLCEFGRGLGVCATIARAQRSASRGTAIGVCSSRRA